jgi:quercetin dioxygenase-like cupin family protein
MEKTIRALIVDDERLARKDLRSLLSEHATIEVIGEADSAPNFAMRQFEVAPGGHTPRHSHPYEHEVFVLEGEGMVSEKDAEHRLRAGDVVYVKPNEVHQFRNTGSKPLKFLCLIP